MQRVLASGCSFLVFEANCVVPVLRSVRPWESGVGTIDRSRKAS